MELKIFVSGFTEQEFNQFIKSNITYKVNNLENGDIYVWFKSPNKLGNDPMEAIETLDKMTKQAQNEIITHKLDIINSDIKLADLKEKQSAYSPNQKEWNECEARINVEINAIKMAEETIGDRKRQVLAIESQAQSILASPK